MKHRNKPYTHWIFIDESGNLSEEYFVVATVVTDNLSTLDRTVRNVKKSMKPSLSAGERFHAHEQNSKSIQMMLSKLVKVDDIKFVIGSLAKYANWRQELDKVSLYNLIVAHTISHTIDAIGVTKSEVKVVIEQQDKFNISRLTKTITDLVNLELDQVSIVRPNHHEWGQGLQAADAIAWSIHRQYRLDESLYLDIIQPLLSIIRFGVDGAGTIQLEDDMLNAK